MYPRSIEEMTYDILSGRFDFKKSKELAPKGYKFLCNHNFDDEKSNSRTIEWYKKQGCIVLPFAYNLYDELIENSVSIYEKIK